MRRVEREARRAEAAHARLGRAREELAQRLDQAGVGRRARWPACARSGSRRRPPCARRRPGGSRSASSGPSRALARERRHERVEHQRALARARGPAHAGELAEARPRSRRRAGCACARRAMRTRWPLPPRRRVASAARARARARRAAPRRSATSGARAISAGVPGRDDAAAVRPAPGPDVDDPVGALHQRLVVLDDDHRVAARRAARAARRSGARRRAGAGRPSARRARSTRRRAASRGWPTSRTRRASPPESVARRAVERQVAEADALEQRERARRARRRPAPTACASRRRRRQPARATRARRRRDSASTSGRRRAADGHRARPRAAGARRRRRGTCARVITVSSSAAHSGSSAFACQASTWPHRPGQSAREALLDLGVRVAALDLDAVLGLARRRRAAISARCASARARRTAARGRSRARARPCAAGARSSPCPWSGSARAWPRCAPVERASGVGVRDEQLGVAAAQRSPRPSQSRAGADVRVEREVARLELARRAGSRTRCRRPRVETRGARAAGGALLQHDALTRPPASASACSTASAMRARALGAEGQRGRSRGRRATRARACGSALVEAPLRRRRPACARTRPRARPRRALDERLARVRRAPTPGPKIGADDPALARRRSSAHDAPRDACRRRCARAPSPCSGSARVPARAQSTRRWSWISVVVATVERGCPREVPRLDRDRRARGPRCGRPAAGRVVPRNWRA